MPAAGQPMTEAEWFDAINPAAMLDFLGSKPTDRKFRLFTVACCRREWHSLAEECRALVEAAEQFADGQLDARRLGAIKGKASRALEKEGASHSFYDIYCQEVARKPASSGAWRFAWIVNNNGPSVEHCDLVRCTFDNPFRPVVFSPAWRTDTAVAIARGMYEARDFGAMPILADALQDAGCDNDDVLTHCRDAAQVHVRGCWVVDLVLQKE